MRGEELDKKIQQLATTDWNTFMQFTTPEMMITLKARILRADGKSWLQIASKLEITPSKARTACKNLAVKK